MATKRSPCPISCTLDILGDRWTLLVIRDLFVGKTHYREFLSSPEGIATNILANRLEKLITAGLVECSPSPERAGAKAYTLSPKGRALFPVLVAIRDWGLANLEGTQARIEVQGVGFD
jgi:DNA-binding HxlR family transcriptional regulator